MPSVRDLILNYDVINEQGTFSEGDTVTGSVTLELEKETNVESLFVKAKGDAIVRWKDNLYERTDDRRFFKLKQFLITKDTVLPEGVHHYKFSFQIPCRSMPSSFRGLHGKIVYKLEAKISRYWRNNKTVEKELNFVSKSMPNRRQCLYSAGEDIRSKRLTKDGAIKANLYEIRSRQVGSTDKEMGSFSKGRVHMDVTVDRTAYFPGQKASIVVKVNNSSSKDMTPRFILKQHEVYHARGLNMYEENDICNIMGKVIIPNAKKTITCDMNIPANIPQTIQNCEIISVEYKLKVYLDISFENNPEVTFPFIIIPAGFRSLPQPGGAKGPHPPAGGPSSSDFPPPAVHMGPYTAPSGPGAYRYSAARSPGRSDFPVYPAQPPTNPSPPVYPAQPPAMGGAYSNPLPQQPSPYGSPYSSSSSSPVNHPPLPTAPMFQPPPSAPVFHPPPSAPPMLNPSPTAPTYNLPPTAPTYDLAPPTATTMDSDFLSQQDKAPPSYNSLFATEVSNPTGSDENKEM